MAPNGSVSASTLFRLGGLSAVIGGVFLGLDVVLHLFVDDTLTPADLNGLAHEAWHAPGIIALPLVLLGLVAIYLAQARESGRNGLWGFVLLVVGMTVGAVYSIVFHGVFLPAIENIETGLFEKLVDNTTAAQFYRGVIVQALGLGLGAVLFGVATIRARYFRCGQGGYLLLPQLSRLPTRFGQKGSSCPGHCSRWPSSGSASIYANAYCRLLTSALRIRTRALRSPGLPGFGSARWNCNPSAAFREYQGVVAQC